MDKEQIIAMGRTYVDGSDAGILFFANALLSANRKQGADARPVAIYQIAFSDEDGWCDTYQKIYESHPEHMRRIVYATRDASQSDAISEEMLTLGVKALLNCTMGELECVSLKLLDSYEADVKRVYEAMLAAIAPREKT